MKSMKNIRLRDADIMKHTKIVLSETCVTLLMVTPNFENQMTLSILSKWLLLISSNNSKIVTKKIKETEISKIEWATVEIKCTAWEVHKVTSKTKISVVPTTEEDSEVATSNVEVEVEEEVVDEEDMVDNIPVVAAIKTTRP